MKSVRLMIAAAAFVGATGAAHAQEVTLTVHHFLSPASPAHTRLIEPWAAAIEEQSGGRIAVEIFPAMAMGGRPPELYRQVRDGAADVVWTLIGYTPGVFPRAEVFELPTVHQGSAEATTAAIQARFDLIAEDFGDVRPILIHVHAGNAFHMVSQRVDGLTSLQGLRLRTPSRTGGWMIEAFGGEPVGMPVPALPQALATNAVDGALVPFEIMPPLRLHELTQYSIEGAGGQRFGTSVFMFAMNQERYDALPADLQAVIDANSGAALAQSLGSTWDDVENPGREMQTGSGGEVVELSEEATAAFNAASETVVRRWIDEATAAGLDGAGLVEAARAAITEASGG